METFHFPDVRLVRVGSQITQVATVIRKSRNGEGDDDPSPRLSVVTERLLQNVIRATVISPPTETTVWIEHDEFRLEINRRPWKIPLKYDIMMGDEIIEASPFKLQFTLQTLQNTPITK